MKPAAPDNCNGVSPLRVLLALLLCALLPLLAFATAPGWWAQRGITVPNASADNYAPANHGQLKNIAKAAVAEMDVKLSGGAGDELHNLVNAWSVPSAQTNDFAPLNIGQLKNVVRPFYDRLISAGLANAYPWAGSTAPADDFAVANIGQVKSMFSFELPTSDVDGDGLPDAWEQQYFGTSGVDPSGDADGDGLTNLQEYQNGSDPTDYYNGNLPTLSIYSGGDQSTIPGNFLALPVSVRVTATGGYNAPLTFTVTQGPALLAPDNSGSSTPARTINIRSTSVVEDENGNQTYLATVYAYLPTTATAASTIEAIATAGSQTVSVSTTAAPLDAATLSPPTNFVATALSATTVALSWTASNAAVPTTLQMSVDGSVTWYTIGVVGPGTESATVTDLNLGMTMSFRAFTGGTYPAGGGNTFPLPSPSGPPAPIPPAPATSPAAVQTLNYPAIMGEIKSSNLAKNGHLGFLVRTHYYLTETVKISTEQQDDNGNWNFSGSTTTVSTYNPITGAKTTQPPQVVGGGGYDVELYGGLRTTVSDTLQQIVGTGYPGDHARSTYTDTLSDLYTDEMLRTNGESRVPAFQNVFTEGTNWAYIYLDPSGFAYSIDKLQYKWHVNPDLTRVVVWDETFTPFDGNGNWNPGTNGENIKHTVKRWAPGGAKDSPVYPIDPTQLNGKQNGLYEVVSIQIELADPNQIGVGAMVPSIKAVDTQHKHFVTPKKAGDSLRFRGTLGDTSNDFDLLYEWHVPNGVTVSGDTVTVPRGTADKYTIELRLKGSSTIVDTLDVWVVWADIAATVDSTSNSFRVPYPSATFVGPSATNFQFLATISPSSLFDTAADIPKLSGPATLPAPGGASLANGVKARWDVSRTKRRKWIDSTGRIGVYDIRGTASLMRDIAAAGGLPRTGPFLINDYPTDPVVGNDDEQTSDEDDNPYSSAEAIPNTAGPTKPGVGQIGSSDAPNSPGLDENFSGGTQGSTLQLHLQFAEFVRLQIGETPGPNGWFRISEALYWKQHILFTKNGSIWKDGGSIQSLDNNGF